VMVVGVGGRVCVQMVRALARRCGEGERASAAPSPPQGYP